MARPTARCALPCRLPTVRQQLLDYYRCLQRWRVRYSTQSLQKNFTLLLEAIKNIDIVEYYLTAPGS